MKKLTEWGLQNAHLKPWVPGHGWQTSVSLRRSSRRRHGHASVARRPGRPLQQHRAAHKPCRTLEEEKDLKKWKGKLKGKIVLAYPTREVKASFDPLATRFNETDLKKLEEVDPTARPAAEL